MINKKEFAGLRKRYEAFDDKREECIKRSREIIKLSKEIIYSVHRKDFCAAEKHLKRIRSLVFGLKKFIHSSDLESAGHVRVAMQEYVEAVSLVSVLKNRRVSSQKSLGVSDEEYLLGLCDLTGELVRYAVNEVIKGNVSAAYEMRSLVSELYAELMLFDFRNSELRKKFDGIKWDLKKLDDLVLGLKLK